MKAAAPPAERWVSIRHACKILGVNQATLRHWTDLGRVRAFLTPGGHRRYSEGELLAMTRQSPNRGEGGSLEGLLLRCRERYESVVRQCTSSNWFQSFDHEARLRFRILGNSMLSLIISFVMASGRRERQRCLEEGREVATQYGKEAADLGLSVSEATQAFLLFRNPVLETISQWLQGPHASHPQPGQVLHRVNQFMDHCLVALAAAYDDRAATPAKKAPVE